MIGLSGLLVKSAQQMVLTAQDLQKANISVPILVGGAALSRKFTKMKISPQYDGPVLYAKDAMDGLSLANELRANPLQFQTKPLEDQETLHKEKETTQPKAVIELLEKRATLPEASIFTPENTKRHYVRDIDLHHIMPYVNEQMLIGHHLSLKEGQKALG